MKHILIIGGTAGIGRRLAEALLENDYTVTIAGRDLTRATVTAAAMRQDPHVRRNGIFGLAADLSKPQTLAETLKDLGEVDHLVLAGMQRDLNAVDDYRIAEAIGLATTKLVGYVTAVSVLRERLSKQGSVLIFGGVAKDIPYPGSTMVTAVSRAVVGLVKTMSVELAPIRVNAIHPGFVSDSPYWKDNHAMQENIRRRVRAPALPTMDDMVSGCRFLMENQAANGINLILDGGFS